MITKEHPQYTIRQVIDLTGVSEYTLRAWESRYACFKPLRTPTGRRVYSKNDILKARLLFELTHTGHKISSIAHLTHSELQDLCGQAMPEAPHDLTMPKPEHEAFHALNRLDIERLRTALNTERRHMRPLDFIYKIILPMIRDINYGVSANSIGIAHEHIVSSLLKENLIHLLGSRATRAQSKKMKLVMATPEGDYHETGLLIAYVFANYFNVKNLYLGPNMPKRELCETSIRFNATHVLLTSTISKAEGAKEEFLSSLHFLDKNLPPKVKILYAGRNTQGLRLELNRETFHLNSFKDLELYFKA